MDELDDMDDCPVFGPLQLTAPREDDPPASRAPGEAPQEAEPNWLRVDAAQGQESAHYLWTVSQSGAMTREGAYGKMKVPIFWGETCVELAAGCWFGVVVLP